MDAPIAIATIVAAALSAGAAILVSVINGNNQHKRFLSELDKQNALVIYRLEQLEAKVNAHNHFDSRLVALEEQVKTLFNLSHKE